MQFWADLSDEEEGIVKKRNINFHIFSIFIFGLFISFLPSAQAATTIQVSFLENDFVDYESTTLSTPAYLLDSEKEKKAKSELSKTLKTKSTLKLLESWCRQSDNFGARVKVTNSNGGTAGLGNLNSFAVRDIKMEEQLEDLPDFTKSQERQRELDQQAWEQSEIDRNLGEGLDADDLDWKLEDWTDPDLIEDGYRSWVVSFDCLFSSKVTITTSNAYTVFIDGKRGPEYTRVELSKMKWKITLVDN